MNFVVKAVSLQLKQYLLVSFLDPGCAMKKYEVAYLIVYLLVFY